MLAQTRKVTAWYEISDNMLYKQYSPMIVPVSLVNTLTITLFPGLNFLFFLPLGSERAIETRWFEPNRRITPLIDVIRTDFLAAMRADYVFSGHEPS